MKYKEIIKRLHKIAQNQQKIINKLAQNSVDLKVVSTGRLWVATDKTLHNGDWNTAIAMLDELSTRDDLKSHIYNPQTDRNEPDYLGNIMSYMSHPIRGIQHEIPSNDILNSLQDRIDKVNNMIYEDPETNSYEEPTDTSLESSPHYKDWEAQTAQLNKMRQELDQNGQ